MSITSPPPSPLPNYLTDLGIGYSIAVALAFLILLSTFLLASYICCCTHSSYTTTTALDGGVTLSRIIFDAGEVNRDGVFGLETFVINSYPKFPFCKEETGFSGTGGSGDDTTCSICLSEYKETEMLRMMPECKHCFHQSCLDTWLKFNGSCPVCRNSPLPTPVSTPLSEVVPLSQFPADRRSSRR